MQVYTQTHGAASVCDESKVTLHGGQENETEKQLRKSVAAGAALTGTAIAGRPSWTPSLL